MTRSTHSDPENMHRYHVYYIVCIRYVYDVYTNLYMTMYGMVAMCIYWLHCILLMVLYFLVNDYIVASSIVGVLMVIARTMTSVC